MQILVDASVWIDYFTGEATPQTDLLDRLLGREALAVADLTIMEVLCGIPDEHHRKQAAEALRKFWMVEIHGLDLAEQCAVHYNTLRARSIEVGDIECWIATWCLQNGFALLHDNPGFEPFEQLGLTVARGSMRTLTQPGLRGLARSAGAAVL